MWRLFSHVEFIYEVARFKNWKSGLSALSAMCNSVSRAVAAGNYEKLQIALSTAFSHSWSAPLAIKNGNHRSQRRPWPNFRFRKAVKKVARSTWMVSETKPNASKMVKRPIKRRLWRSSLPRALQTETESQVHKKAAPASSRDSRMSKSWRRMRLACTRCGELQRNQTKPESGTETRCHRWHSRSISSNNSFVGFPFVTCVNVITINVRSCHHFSYRERSDRLLWWSLHY